MEPEWVRSQRVRERWSYWLDVDRLTSWGLWLTVGAIVLPWAFLHWG